MLSIVNSTSAPIQNPALAYGSLNATSDPTARSPVNDGLPASAGQISSILSNHPNIPTPAPDALNDSASVEFAMVEPAKVTSTATSTELATSVQTSTTVEMTTKSETTTTVQTFTTIATITVAESTTQTTTITAHETTTCEETSTTSVTDTLTVPGPTLTSTIASTTSAETSVASPTVAIPASAISAATASDDCTTSSTAELPAATLSTATASDSCTTTSPASIPATIVPATAHTFFQPQEPASFNTPPNPATPTTSWNTTSPCVPTTLVRIASGGTASISGIADNCVFAAPSGMLPTAPGIVLSTGATCTTTFLHSPTFAGCTSTVLSATSITTVDCNGCVGVEQTRVPLPNRPVSPPRCSSALHNSSRPRKSFTIELQDVSG